LTKIIRSALSVFPRPTKTWKDSLPN